jgi:hypothetical protein
MNCRRGSLLRALALAGLVSVASMASAKPAMDMPPDVLGAIDNVIEAVTAALKDAEATACVKALSEPFARLRPQLDAQVRRQDAYRNWIPQAFTDMSTASGRKTAKAALAELEQLLDSGRQLSAQFASDVRSSIAKLEGADTVTLGMCLGGFEFSVRESEPYSLRLVAATRAVVQAGLDLVDAFGRAHTVRQSLAPSGVAVAPGARHRELEAAALNWSIALDEQQRAMDTKRVYREVNVKVLREMMKPTTSR